MTDQIRPEPRDQSATATAERWGNARKRRRRASNLMAILGLIVVALLALPLTLLTTTTASGDTRYPIAVGWLALMMIPVAFALWWRSVSEQGRSDAFADELTHLLNAELSRQEEVAHRQEFESRLSNAFEMAEGEPDVLDIIERSFALTLPNADVELLLADNSHAHLLRVASTLPSSAPPCCLVDSPDHCPAARRAQVQRFSDSEAIDSCPKLRGRESGATSAVCVPLAIMGRTVGVIHATRPQHEVFPEEAVLDLETLAKLSGARLGLLRVMAKTQLQAATDSLTGLLNRRSFEEQMSAVGANGQNFALAMADLDHFKQLNDTYGHETGDRALRVFSQVLCNSLRAHDLVSRHGGEEFVVALPSCGLDSARDLLNGVRERLTEAIVVAGLPTFTVSFGIVETAGNEDVPAAIGRADVALFQAKRDGRDRVVVHDGAGNAVVAGPNRVVDLNGVHRPRVDILKIVDRPGS